MSWNDNGDNTSTFENKGAITIALGAGTFIMSSSPGRPGLLYNTGSIEIASGTFQMRVDGSSTGLLTVDTDATLKIDSNAFFQMEAGSH